ncbi:MAG: hypothetical protein HY815_16605 [Candidatus Riflebacteria bacterium]|nr:hypothetical protein [Candidatus Riflebacteria bacterium]
MSSLRSLAALTAWSVLLASASTLEARSLPEKKHDLLLAKKQRVEALKAQVDAATRATSGCCDLPAMGRQKKVCLDAAAAFKRELEAGTWAYYVGNYDEAYRQLAQAAVRGRQLEQLAALARRAVDGCVRRVAGGLAMLKKLELRFPRIKDAAARAQAEKACLEATKALQSLEKTCSTTDPAAVIREIDGAVRTVELLSRKAR